MGIDRYILKNRRIGEYFGESEINESPNLRWYYAKDRSGATNKIGLEGKLTPEADNFLCGFLYKQDESLYYLPVDKTISRASDRSARLDSNVEGIENIAKLMEFLSTTPVYAFLTSCYDNGHNPSILTFSTSPPSERLYNPSSNMQTKLLGQDYLQQRKRSFNSGDTGFSLCESRV